MTNNTETTAIAMPEHNFKVSTRVRPLNQREIDEGSVCCMEVSGNKIILHPQDATRDKKEFTYNQSYWSCNPIDPHYAGQDRLFEDIGKSVVQSAAEGYNACVFAYGQTGSGKTHTMMGSDAEPGLVPRICRSLLDVVKQETSNAVNHKITLSYLEIYNEKMRDLLCDYQSKTTSGMSVSRMVITAAKNPRLLTQNVKKLELRESTEEGNHVPGLTQFLVTSYEEIEALLHLGNACRSTAKTLVNAQSSRSHAVLTLTYSMAVLTKDAPTEIRSKLHLVDLAGSERVKKTGVTGVRLTEACRINCSLSTLSRVLCGLSEGGKAAAHVPYRDSLLTRLLHDSLGGNSKTFMIASISPASLSYEESLSTLCYAHLAKGIVNKPTVNEDPKVKFIRELTEALQKSKMELRETKIELQWYKDHRVAPETETKLTQKQRDEQILTMNLHQRWADGDQEDSQEETLESSLEWPSPIIDATRVVKKLDYPEPTDSGVGSQRDTDDEEDLDDSVSSLHSTICHSSFSSALHDDDDTTPSPPSPSSKGAVRSASSPGGLISASSPGAVRSPSSPDSLRFDSSPGAVRSAFCETGTWKLHTEPTTRDDRRHSTPTRNIQDATRQSSTPPGPPQKGSRSIFTQTFLEDDHNECLQTRSVEELVHHYSSVSKDIESNFIDLSVSCLSNALLTLPDDACSKILASIIEKEVQNRVSKSFCNSPTNYGVTSPTGTCGVPSRVNESLARPSLSSVVDLCRGYKVTVSSEIRFLVEPFSQHYYVVNFNAGRKGWTVYAKFNDVMRLKTDLEKTYPELRSVFEQHAALLNRRVRGLKSLPTKQELQMLLRDLLALLTQPISLWSPLSSGPPSQSKFRGLHKFFCMGLSDELFTIIRTLTKELWKISSQVKII